MLYTYWEVVQRPFFAPRTVRHSRSGLPSPILNLELFESVLGELVWLESQLDEEAWLDATYPQLKTTRPICYSWRQTQNTH
ncbi:hypothetical protein AWB64_01290 [Caballeronia sordidicola]|uniref:Uncharacterized protein n=1 Tax=Caballeronia sordidicola TaxID=196367 RepID=A0A158FFX2_CABSO|nr:hypothetical protein AWB64_01290 [Caballeronia sordidicola]